MNEPGSAMRRTLLSRSAAIFFIRVCPAIAMAAVTILFSHRLSRELNGIYQRLWVYMAVLLSIAAFGIQPLMLTHRADDVHSWLLGLRRRHIDVFTVWLGLLSCALIEFLPSGAFPVVAVFMLLSGQVMILLLETYLIINRRFGAAAVSSFVYALVFCALHVLFVYGRISFAMLIGGISALTWVRAGAMAISGQRVFRTGKVRLQQQMPHAIQMQWLQLGVYDVSQIIFRWIDKAIVSWLVGPALFAIYLTGTTDVPLMPLMLGAVGNALLQQLASATHAAHEERIKLASFSGSVLARIVFPLFFFLLFFRYEFVEIVFSRKYLPAVPLFAISVMVLPLRAYNYTSILQHLNRVTIINWGAMMDLLIALSLAFVLFQWKGLLGVAFAFMVSSYVQAAFYLIKTSQLLRCSVLQLIPWKQWLVMLIVFGFLAIGLHELLTRYCSVQQRLLLGFIGTAIIIGASLLPVVFTSKRNG